MDDKENRRVEPMDFPSNSHKARQGQGKDEPKKIEKVVKGTVVTRKKSLSKRIAETLFGDDVDSVFGYVMHDVLVPAVKSTLSDMVSGGIEMLLFGETKGARRRDGSRSYTSYSSYYKSDRDRNDRRNDTRSRSARHSFEDVILETRGEAEEVLGQLVEIIDRYEMVSIADLYEMVGITGSFTDNKYGWTNLSDASVRRVRDGYLIDLPRVVLLD